MPTRPIDRKEPLHVAALALLEQLAARNGVGPCEGGAGAEEGCFFPQCLAAGCPGEKPEPDNVGV